VTLVTAGSGKVAGSHTRKHQDWAREIEEEKKLTRQKTIVGTTFARTASRALAHGVVLLLLFTPQSWAGVVCICKRPDASGHACCRLARHDNPAVETREEGSDSHSSHCKGREAVAPCAKFDYTPQGVKSRCQSVQEDGAQAAITSSTKQLPINHPPAPVYIGAQNFIAPTSNHIHPQRRNRLLYLALSCWRI
jgi:hypothetical protein